MEFTIRKTILLLALLCILLMFIGGPGLYALRSVQGLWDLGHVICSALWAWIYLQWRPKFNFWPQFLLVLLLTLTIGGTIELLQAQMPASYGREGSWLDLQKDLLGSLLVLMFFAPNRKQVNLYLLRWGQLLVLIMAFWSLYPLARAVANDLLARQQFPLISGFETSLEADRWEGNSQYRISKDVSYDGQAALQVNLNTDHYSGVALRYFPVDWSTYRLLRLSVYNPQAEILTLHLKIQDRLHRQSGNAYSDRFNASYALKQGWTNIELPLERVASAPVGRRMKMDQISALGLFVINLDQPRTIYIDEVRLEK